MELEVEVELKVEVELEVELEEEAEVELEMEVDPVSLSDLEGGSARYSPPPPAAVDDLLLNWTPEIPNRAQVLLRKATLRKTERAKQTEADEQCTKVIVEEIAKGAAPPPVTATERFDALRQRIREKRYSNPGAESSLAEPA